MKSQITSFGCTSSIQGRLINYKKGNVVVYLSLLDLHSLLGTYLYNRLKLISDLKTLFNLRLISICIWEHQEICQMGGPGVKIFTT